MFAFLRGAERLAHLSVAGVNGEMSALQPLYGGEDDIFAFGIESQNLTYQPISFS